MGEVVLLPESEDDGYIRPRKPRELILLDDDDEDGSYHRHSQGTGTESESCEAQSKLPPGGAVGGGGGGGLTIEQRKRMALQKELALERRRLAQENSREDKAGAGLPGVPPASQNFPSWSRGASSIPASSNLDGRRGEFSSTAAPSASASLGATPWPQRLGGSSRRRRERGSFGLGGDGGVSDDGWRSVRKRLSPGHSGMQDSWEGWNDGDSLPAANGKDGGGGGLPSIAGDEEEPVWDERLSERQKSALKAVRRGSNVFLTGSAGTGKSFVLEHAIKLLRNIYGESFVYVTASTGLAACALGGTTLHSFAGVGLGTGSKEVLVDKVCSRRDTKNRWLGAGALVLDEVSMIDGTLFDKLDYVGRMVRNSSRPFGGIQLLVSGDFYQLPPVKPENPAKFFAFQADCWENSFDKQIELEIVFRQADEDFVGMLNEIRRGRCSPSIQRRLQNCSGPTGADASGVVLTRLYPLRVDVSQENEQSLRALRQPITYFHAIDKSRNEFVKRQLESVGAVPVLALSVGAQVMLAKNLEPGVGLVNGARGVVVGFTAPDDPRYDDMKKDPAGPVSPSNVWPIVRFACDGLERAVVPEDWNIMEGDVELAQRTQVPLILAWALSVHKCQGMTLDRVETDLSKAFGFGMLYVALSRVKSLDGLRLIGFDPHKIKVHPQVARFYENLGQESMGRTSS